MTRTVPDHLRQSFQVVGPEGTDKCDAEPVVNDRPRWTAKDVAEYLQIAPKRVYELDIPQVRLSERTIRYDPEDVFAWEQKRKSRGMR